MNITLKTSFNIDKNNNWFAGFFDADGTITYSWKGKYLIPQLTISVGNKLYCDIVDYPKIFGGNIYYDTSHNGFYKWSIQSWRDIENMATYFKQYPSKSIKSKRIHLIPQYYYLCDMKAYRNTIESSVQYKAWKQFEIKWFSKFD